MRSRMGPWRWVADWMERHVTGDKEVKELEDFLLLSGWSLNSLVEHTEIFVKWSLLNSQSNHLPTPDFARYILLFTLLLLSVPSLGRMNLIVPHFPASALHIFKIPYILFPTYYYPKHRVLHKTFLFLLSDRPWTSCFYSYKCVSTLVCMIVIVNISLDLLMA